MSGSFWVEVVFMMVILKIPVVYLCAVVWWAVRAEPRPLDELPVRVSLPEPEPGPSTCGWRGTRRRPPRPTGGRGRRRAVRRPRASIV